MLKAKLETEATLSRIIDELLEQLKEASPEIQASWREASPGIVAEPVAEIEKLPSWSSMSSSET